MSAPAVPVAAVMRDDHQVQRNDLAQALQPMADSGEPACIAAAGLACRDAIAVRAAIEGRAEGAGDGPGQYIGRVAQPGSPAGAGWLSLLCQYLGKPHPIPRRAACPLYSARANRSLHHVPANQ